MKTRQIMMAAAAVTMCWSTNVAYEYQTGHSFFRSIASEESEITVENVIAHVTKMKERVDRIVEVKGEIEGSLNADELSLADLISHKRGSLNELRGLLDKHREDKTALNKFLEDKEGQVVEAVNSRMLEINKTLGAHDFTKLSLDLSNAIEKQMEIKTVEQQKALEDLQSNLCEQNRELSSISSKLDKLLEEPKKVISKVEKDDDKEERKEESSNNVDALALFNAFNASLSAQANSFFSAPQFTGLASEANPMGLDVNFLMMTKILTGSNGFGPRANINYAPVYNQQRTFYGMPQMYNLDRNSTLNTGFQMADPNMIKGALPGNIFPGFNFGRGQGLSSEFSLLTPTP